VFTVVTSVSEVIVTFLQLILFANTAAFFCSLLGLVSHFFSEGEVRKSARDGCVQIELAEVTYAILGLFYVTMAYKPAFQYQ